MPVMSQAEIADLMRETRQRLGLTQTQLAQELGGFVSKRKPLLRTGGIYLCRWSLVRNSTPFY